MASVVTPDLCIIGGGSAGLSLAAGAAQMGAQTVLIESGKMGGDCLNYGCVPSKSVIACGKAAAIARGSTHLGVTSGGVAIDLAKVRQHVEQVIKTIEPHDSVERFTGLGVQVIEDQGEFYHADEVRAGGLRIRARRFAIATGSRASIPPIPGLDQVDYLTNETVFEATGELKHLLIVGAGPIGCELAQAYARLGVTVSLFDMGSILPREDPEMRDVVRERLLADGVELFEQCSIQSVAAGPKITFALDRKTDTIAGSHILIATGRRPNIENIGLDAAGIAYTRAGITVNARLQTSNPKIYAMGECNGHMQFTHAAGYQAGVVLKNVLLRIPAKASAQMPRVTFTDPEIAYVGRTEAELSEQGVEHKVMRFSFSGNDRALADAHGDGFCKVMVSAKGKILGAGLVGHQAGDLLAPWVHAVENQLKIAQIASTVMPYPTYSEINKRVAGQYFQPQIFGERMKSIVRFLARFG